MGGGYHALAALPASLAWIEAEHARDRARLAARRPSRRPSSHAAISVRRDAGLGGQGRARRSPFPRIALRRMSPKVSSSGIIAGATGVPSPATRLLCNRERAPGSRKRRYGTRHHHRIRSRRIDRRRLCGAGESRTAGSRRRPVRRPAHADDRGRELPGLPRRHHGTRSDDEVSRAGRTVRRAHRKRGRDARWTSRASRSWFVPDEDEYQAKTVIVATGASARWLDVPGRSEAARPRRLDAAPLATGRSFATSTSSSSAAATRRWKRRSFSRASAAG